MEVPRRADDPPKRVPVNKIEAIAKLADPLQCVRPGRERLTMIQGTSAMDRPVEDKRTLPRRLLVPVDFTEPTGSLIAHARGIAALAAGHIDLVYVLEEPAALRLFQVDGFRAMLPQLASRSRARLLREAESVPGPRVPLRAHVLIGDPAREITRYAEAQRIDLVLLGTHGEAGPRTAGLGSVPERVMRTAPCPVLALNVAGESLVRPPSARPRVPTV